MNYALFRTTMLLGLIAPLITVHPPIWAQSEYKDPRLEQIACFVFKPPVGASKYGCDTRSDYFQIKLPKTHFTLLDKFNLNTSYNFVSKYCEVGSVQGSTVMEPQYFVCTNSKEGWSADIYFSRHVSHAFTSLHVREIKFETCSSGNAEEAYQSVIQKFGKPETYDPETQPVVFLNGSERMNVSHRRDTPKGYGAAGGLQCPSKFRLSFTLSAPGLSAYREGIHEEYERKSSQGVKPKF